MELKDFVEDTLLQIIRGVRSAQKAEAKCLPDEKDKQLCMVHFDVSIGSDSMTNADGKAGAFFGTLMIRGRAATEDKQSLQNKVQFDVPIYLFPLKDKSN